MKVSCIDISNALRDHFPVCDGSDHRLLEKVKPHLGFRVLPLTGSFVRNLITKDIDTLIDTLKQVLPPDAMIMACDGNLMRMESNHGGYGADRVVITFWSKTWPAIEEGALIPRLEPIFHSKRPSDDSNTYPEFIYVPVLSEGHACDIAIDKTKYTMSIPRHREDDTQLVIEIRLK